MITGVTITGADDRIEPRSGEDAFDLGLVREVLETARDLMRARERGAR